MLTHKGQFKRFIRVVSSYEDSDLSSEVSGEALLLFDNKDGGGEGSLLQNKKKWCDYTGTTKF